MKTTLHSNSSIQPHRHLRSLILFAGTILTVLCCAPAAFATNGTIQYLDVNSTTAGFGNPDGNTYFMTTGSPNTVWSTDATGVAAPVTFVSGDQMTFGNTANQVTGTFTINLDSGANLNGIVVSNSGANVTLTGTANTHATSASTWTVVTGSTLTLNEPRQSFDAGGTTSLKSFNANSQTITFTGGGTMNFISPIGANSSALVTENMSGGTVNFQMGSAVPSGAGTYTGGFTLTAGTLNFASAGSVNQFYGFIAGKNFSINGGTIDNTSGSSMTLNLGAGGYSLGGNFTFTGSSSLNFNTNAAVLTGTRTVTVNANTLSIGGILSGAFGVNKAGAGTLALTGSNTYSGLTTVSAGKLITTTAAIGGGSYSNANSATLDVQVAAAGQSLNMNTLTLGSSSASSLQIDTGALGNPTVPVINATNLVLNGAVTINLFGTGLTTGTFTILTNSPGLRTGGGSFTLSASPRLHATLNDDTANNRVTITISSTPDTSIIWDGSASGNWNINNGGNNTWKANVSGAATDYTEDAVNGNDAVQFTDAATGTTNVNLTTTLSPAGITVSNTAATATANYTFSGVGKISGTTGLLKLSTGNLTLAESGGDNFTGGLSISNGTLVLDDAGSAISGSTTIGGTATLQVGNNDANGSLPSGAMVDNGSLIFIQNANVTVSKAISGAGTLTQNGSAVLTLNSSNSSFAGGVTINSGTLQVTGNGGNSSLGKGNTTVNPGATLIGTNADAFGFNSNNNPTNINILGIVTDSGITNYRITLPNLTFTGGLLTNNPANTGDVLGGHYSFNSGLITTLPSATTATIGAGIVSPQAATTFNVASGTTPNGIDLLISSVIQPYNSTVRNITKIGSGVLAFSGADTYTGNTVISNGTLELIGSASLATPQIALTNGAKFDVSQLSTPFTLNANQTIGGTGVVTGNVTTAGSSMIDAGLYGGHTLNFMNNLTMGSGASNRFVLSTTTSGVNSKIAVAGALDVSAGGIVVQINYTTLQNGRYQLFTYGSLVGGAANLTLSGYTAGGRQSAALDDSIAGEIDLVLTGTAGDLTWFGDGVNNNWDIATTSNWSNNVSHASDLYFDGDVVTFNDLGSKNPSLNLPGTVQPASILVANNSGTYTFSDTGSGKISGFTALTKQGSGTLALMESGGDDFSGGITVGGGSLILSNNNVNISGGFTITNGIVTIAHSGTISGGLNMNNTAGGSPSALIVGSGTLNGNITAVGSLTISNSPTIVGNLTVSNGTTLLDEDSTPTGNATIASGATVQVGNNDTTGNLPSGTMTMNGLLIFNRSDDTTISKVIAGASTGNLMKTNIDAIVLSAANTFTGAVTVASGTLRAGNAAALGKTNTGTTISAGATLDVNGFVLGGELISVSGIGMTNTDGSTNGAINNGSGTAATPALNFVTLTGDTVFGTIGGRWDLGSPGGATGDPATSRLDTGGQPYKLTKVGSQFFGLRTVTVDPQLGDVDVQAGIFNIEGNTTGLGNSASNLFVRSGATLELFNATNQLNKQIKLDDGATVLNGAGTNTVIGPITFGGNETFNASAAFLTLSGQLNGTGTLTKTGTNTLTLTAAGNNYVGDTTVNAGTLALSGSGTVSSAGTITLNTANLDISRENSAFTLTTNILTMNSSSKLIVSNSAPASIGTFNMNDSVLQLPVTNLGTASIYATNLNLGGATNTINVVLLATNLPLAQTQFPLIEYTALTGTFDLGVSIIQPAGFLGYISNNVANNSIDLVMVGSPATTVWNGGNSATDNNWSDAINWSGVTLLQDNNLIFAGTVGLNNTNDTVAGAIYGGITFSNNAGAFIWNGNPITVAGNITNNSSNPQTIELGINYGASRAIAGGTAGLIIGGGLTNSAPATATATTLTLFGTGTLTNLLSSGVATTNIITLNNAAANWTLVDNSSATPISLAGSSFNIIGGATFNFGNAGSAPNLSITSGSGTDNGIGNGTGTSAFNMVNGTLTTSVRFNTAGTGNINVSGGTMNIGNQIQNANGAATDVGIISVSGGTVNSGGTGGGGVLYVASRGTGTLNVSGSAAINCGTLDVSRNAAGTTAGSVGTVNLNGGTLLVNRVGTATQNSQSGIPGTATFNFNGGTLKAKAASATFLQGSTVAPIMPITSIVKSGGAIIDDGGFAITALEPLQHDSTLGGTADGGLTKNGSGTLTLGGTVNTYTGSTKVGAGTLALSGAASIDNSVGIIISNSATLDVSARANGTLNLVSGQTLQTATNGTLTGNLTNNVGSTVAPGGSGAIGTLTVSGNVTLNGTASMKLIKTTVTTNDLLTTASGSITYAGTLNVTLLSGTLAASDSFQLFNAASYVGTFSATNLPSLAGGLAWIWNPANGTLSIASSGPGTFTNAPGGLTFSLNGGNVVITGTGGQAGDAYYLLASTNVALPLSQWTVVATNVLGANGSFTFTGTNAVTPGDAQQFYILSNTNSNHQ